MSWLRAFERVSALVLVLWSTNQRPPTNCHQPTATNQLPTPTPWCSLLCKGSDVRPGVLWSPWLLRGRRSTWYSASHPMVSVAFAWQAQHLVQGVGCTPFCLAGAALVLCKGSDVRPGGLLHDRRSTWCSARGRMCALASYNLCEFVGGWLVAIGGRRRKEEEEEERKQKPHTSMSMWGTYICRMPYEPSSGHAGLLVVLNLFE